VSTESADRQYRFTDLLRDPAFLIDTALAPVVFVAASAWFGLVPAAVVAVTLAVAVLTWRLLRRERFANALLGLLGVLLAVSIAIATGSAEGYFWPKVFISAAWALALVGSVVVGRPAIAFLAHSLYRLPWAWLTHDQVRPAYAEATLMWAAWAALKAGVYLLLILAAEPAALAAVSTVLTFLPFLLMYATYRYIAWRLPRLNPPWPEELARAT
jgi:hypothetical protein